MRKQTTNLIGYAVGVAGAEGSVDEGPLTLQQSSLLATFKPLIQWSAMIESARLSAMTIVEQVKQAGEALAHEVSLQVQQHASFAVIGGDHTSAIGTWSGVYDALYKQGELGLIWIDAHMDSHTPQTSESGRVHGMPLACLLGYGDHALINILHATPKIQPHNLCLIGVRSFEKGEAELLKRLNVRVYFMEEVRERGFAVVLQEAVQHVSAQTIKYGISLDLDAIDPLDAPGVDVPEPNGIRIQDLLLGLSLVAKDKRYVGTEIVEFDPSRDKNKMTEKIIVAILQQLYFGASA